MPPTIDDVIDVLRRLSPERQEELAGYIFELARENEPAGAIDPAHLPYVMEGLAQVRRGERASRDEVAAAFRSFGE